MNSAIVGTKNSRRRPIKGIAKAVAVLVSAMTAVIAVPLSAQAATSSYFVSFQSSAYLAKGNVIWSSSSVDVGGSVKAPSGRCAMVAFATDGVLDETRTVCGGTRTFGFTIPGAASVVRVDLYSSSNGGASWVWVNADRCTPSACVTTT